MFRKHNKHLTKSYLINGSIHLLLGILFLCFFVSLGLTIALYVRPFYYLGMEQISIETGYSTAEIKENYDALIDWCSPFAKGELSFPTLPASESGLSHFHEVKDIFRFFFALLLLTPVPIASLIFLEHRRGSRSYLWISPLICCILPCIIAIGCAVSFDRVFVLFHEIVFRNDDWLFSYVTDPIILFLPERFFLQCAVIILATVFLGSLTLFSLFLVSRRKACYDKLTKR